MSDVREEAPRRQLTRAQLRRALPGLVPPPRIDPRRNFPSITLSLNIKQQQASGNFDNAIQFFEACEHESITDCLLIVGDDECTHYVGSHRHGGGPIHIVRSNSEEARVSISLGRLIAVAGDHYTSTLDYWRTPICGAFFDQAPNDRLTQKLRFKSMYDSIMYDTEGYFVALNALLDREFQLVRETFDAGGSVRDAYHYNDLCGIPTDKEMWELTSSLASVANFFTNSLKWGPMGMYGYIAWINADHFGEDAITAYSVGHELALDMAHLAGGLETSQARDDMLLKAYACDACAAHYLTDLFSAGHVRAPRRQLHCHKRFKTMCASYWEIPIWDAQCRYMHDADSATGLLVRNKRGHQWIAYGDKHLFESGNVINRRRAQIALQASMNEVYNVFRAAKNGAKKPIVSASSFAALELVPQPMVSASYSSWSQETHWGGYEQHNPAPLWRANTLEPGTRGTISGWYVRGSIDDHSVFEQEESSPGDRNTGNLIKNSSFVKHQYIGCGNSNMSLESGGFLQIQDLCVNDGVRTCVNIWGPARVNFVYNHPTSPHPDQSFKRTFTLRNRLIDMCTESAEVVPLHWLSWFDDVSHTVMVRFDLIEDNIMVSWYELDQGSREQDVIFKDDMNSSWAMRSTMRFHHKKLLSVDIRGSQSPPPARFLLGTFSEDSYNVNPDIVALTIRGDGMGRLVLRCTESEDRDDGTQIVRISDDTVYTSNLNFAGSQQVYLKAFYVPGSLTVETPKLALLQFSQMNSQTSVTAKVTMIQPRSGSNDFLHTDFEVSTEWKYPLRKTCVLVGDLFRSGHSNFALVATDEEGEHTTIKTYGFSDSSANSEIICTGDHRHCKIRAPRAASYKYVLTHANALIRDLNSYGKRLGLDVLTISVYRDLSKQKPELDEHGRLRGEDQRYRLFLHLHRRPNWDEKKNTQDVLWECEGTAGIVDPLFGLGEEGHYVSLRWQGCKFDKDRRAVMEIFSLYGVLGMRVFSFDDLTRQYKHMTTIPYLGQTSIGTGLGVYRDWGSGLLSWGHGHDFVDMDFWLPHEGMGKWREALVPGQDENINIIRGWDVKQRPGYHGRASDVE